jgi:hypothetical protein
MVVRSERPLNETEKRILEKLLSLDNPDAKVLRKQIPFCSATDLDEFGSIEIKCHQDDVTNSVHGPFVTGQQEDIDTLPNFGPYINYIIFVDNGRLSELQIYKDDGSVIRQKVDPDKFILTYGTPKKV